MIKSEIRKAIEKELYKQAEMLNFPVLEVKDLYDNFCEIRITAEQSRQHPGMAYHLATQLMQIKGIEKVYDTGARAAELAVVEERRLEITVGPDQWTHTEDDEKAFNDSLRRYFDPVYDKMLREKEDAERMKHWRDYILPIPACPKHYSTELYLTLAYEPYDFIKNGEKRTEFRSYTPLWVQRILSHPLSTVRLQRGYGGAGRPKPEQMTFEIKGIKLYDIRTGTETDPYKPEPIIPTHFAIDLGRRLQ